MEGGGGICQGCGGEEKKLSSILIYKEKKNYYLFTFIYIGQRRGFPRERRNYFWPPSKR